MVKKRGNDPAQIALPAVGGAGTGGDAVAMDAPDDAHINYALVEGVRPPMYTAMKYWGKKPHNIWRQFIERYCPIGGVIMDPFAGSAMAAFEAIKAGRKAIALDLNPLTSFVLEVFASPFDEPAFRTEFTRIHDAVEADPVYQSHFLTLHGGAPAVIHNYRWERGSVVHKAVEIPKPTKQDKRQRFIVPADAGDHTRAAQMGTLALPYWYPTERFPTSPIITHKFIADIGGNSFANLWTRRNLYLLSRIFQEILQVQSSGLRIQLLFGFVQTLHLSSRMVVPRNKKANRDFSGSWGRADYMVRQREMEQNPLVVFRRSCLEKQGVIAALKDAHESLPPKITVNNLNANKKIKAGATLNYGTVDIADLGDYVRPQSVDFVITDPPYAGLVRYLDLSLVWLVWLKHVDTRYAPDHNAEITLAKGPESRTAYRRRLQQAFQQIHTALKDDGYLVVTFHHPKLREWNDFVNAVRAAGFRFDKVTHQYNRRSGESNVSMPYGTSGADFYIRCVKKRDIDFTDDRSGLEHFIRQKAIETIAARGEKTPYEFIVAALIPEMLQAGYLQPDEYKSEIRRVLEADVGKNKIFEVTENPDTKAGDYWWFNDPREHINHPDRPLADRVADEVLGILRRKISVRFDDVLGRLFQNYPNGLTPDPRSIRGVLERFAVPAAGKWKLKPAVERLATEHTAVIQKLLGIGARAGFATYAGKREQPDVCADGRQLHEHATIRDLAAAGLPLDEKRLERVRWIDALWLDVAAQSVACVFEVENSTAFMSAIQRGSNLSADIPKFMVIPDGREAELRATIDPLFSREFNRNGWQYLTYSAVERLARHAKPSVAEFAKAASTLPEDG
ncbi:MAG TPA: hypothetical protein VGB24_08625 [Longimicrobium sp.]|jgi:hypothetical protein|uniref:hypothetical protein n=1 Tax=Longimicrobium sp. TaxID=2029185 RepID=UPI002EDB4296